MPVTGVFDVASITIHDHFIRVDTSDARPSTKESALRFPESPTGDWKRFAWPGEQPPKHQDDIGLWMMAYVAGGHTAKALALVDEPPGHTSANIPMYHHARAGLLANQDRKPEAINSYRQALKLDPGLAPSTINLALLLGETGSPNEGITLLTNLLTRFPKSDSALRNRAVLKFGIGDKNGFAKDLEAAFRNAPNPAVAQALANHYSEQGQPNGAHHWQSQANQLQPK
jgi:predicted Zn-dependent protease